MIHLYQREVNTTDQYAVIPWVPVACDSQDMAAMWIDHCEKVSPGKYEFRRMTDNARKRVLLSIEVMVDIDPTDHAWDADWRDEETGNLVEGDFAAWMDSGAMRKLIAAFDGNGIAYDVGEVREIVEGDDEVW